MDRIDLNMHWLRVRRKMLGFTEIVVVFLEVLISELI